MLLEDTVDVRYLSRVLGAVPAALAVVRLPEAGPLA
jgi:hypothetical protein